MTQAIEINKDSFFDWIKLTEKKWLSIIVAGQIFGGRPGEAPQTPKGFQIISDTLLITFNTTERLWVKNPVGIEINTGKLTIKSAKIIRWGWHYYGRPQTDLNWCEEVFIVNKDEITKTDLAPLDGQLETQTKTFNFNSNFPIVSISEY
jgi:hypothetical protein